MTNLVGGEPKAADSTGLAVADPLGLDVVIPSRGEGAGLAACLTGVLWDAGSLRLRVIVVLNGEAQAEGASVARAFRKQFAIQGHELRLLRSAPGKFHALNAAEAFRRRVPVVYLDADVVPAPGLLTRLHAALATCPEPILASPRLFLAHDGCRAARAFGAVWHALPAVWDGVIGGGCYAVNPAGRALWGEFPPISGDDAFVCARFEGYRCEALSDAAMFVRLPSGWRALVSTRARWLRSAREGRAFADQLCPERGVARNWRRAQSRPSTRLRALISKPHLWRHLPGFLAVDIAARAEAFRQKGVEQRPDWVPQREHVECARVVKRPQIHVVVVSHNSERDLSECLSSLKSEWAQLSITVFDNASGDSSAAVAEAHDGVRVIRSAVNLGFAAAVNRAVETYSGAAQWILLINPDARVDRHAIDTLLAGSLRYPGAGVLGGLGRSPDGRPLAASCLAAPSFGRAIRYALGMSSGLGMPHLVRASVRQAGPVPAVSGAFMLVTQEAWRLVGGFDERYFLYGEDVDLCLRLRVLGRQVVSVGAAGYSHVGSASSASAATRRVMMMSGTITLYSLHAGPFRAAAQMLVRIGLLLRLTLRLPHDREARAVWYQRRRWWRGYALSPLDK